MNLEYQKANTILSHTTLREVKDSLKHLSFPLLIVNYDHEIQGIVKEEHFWRGAALHGWDEKVDKYIDPDFRVYDSWNQMLSENEQWCTYTILKKGHEVQIYSKAFLLHYVYEKLKKDFAKAEEVLEEAKQENKDFLQIINASYDEIFVSNGDGDVLFVSEASKKVTGYPPEIFIGKNMVDLVEEGIISNSVTLKVLKSHRTETVQQEYENGRKVIVTGKPIFSEDGKLHRVMINTRDITELIELQNKLDVANAIMKKKNVSFKKEGNLITRSRQMNKILELMERVAPIDSSILIEGESGVGKGVLAKFIHDLSPRKNKEFVQVNCGAIPISLIESELFGYEGGAYTGAKKGGKKGLVELADGGTLFLDEIGELPLDVQVKLLNLVQDKVFKRLGGNLSKRVDIRIVAATNRHLKSMVESGKFREDLYYRLHVVPVNIPPLRERKEDIELLVQRFLFKYNKDYHLDVSFDESVIDALTEYDWPGNIRELENLVEQLVVTSQNQLIHPDDLPSYLQPKMKEEYVTAKGIIPLKQAVEEVERQILRHALKKYHSSRKIAHALEVNQTTIIRKLKKYNMNVQFEE
ncbi:sigma-54 interaction domain-containing protein [Neobacillus sp. NRS-1170]|uniref:sigma-54 interaction domain-containing protein n=1 Tax=Neobacillus sp. NRS-1170 TaxID=3233898 RepID=UPI003D2E1B18